MSVFVLKYVGESEVSVSESDPGVSWPTGYGAVTDESVKDAMLATERWTLFATVPTIG